MAQCLSFFKKKKKKGPAHSGDARDSCLISGSGRSPGGEHGNPLQYFCLENPMNRGAKRAIVRVVAKSLTLLSTGESRLTEPTFWPTQ